jgi:diacylglycerol O-acyltransferase
MVAGPGLSPLEPGSCDLDHPFWIEDPDFDLDFHIRHTAIPPPGRDDQLANLVARIIGRPLDRTRPLWVSG